MVADAGATAERVACRWQCGKSLTAFGVKRHENKCALNAQRSGADEKGAEEGGRRRMGGTEQGNAPALPPEILDRVLSHAGPKTLVSARSVNRFFRDVCRKKLGDLSLLNEVIEFYRGGGRSSTCTQGVLARTLVLSANKVQNCDGVEFRSVSRFGGGYYNIFERKKAVRTLWEAHGGVQGFFKRHSRREKFRSSLARTKQSRRMGDHP